jgi:hypothetical protein
MSIEKYVTNVSYIAILAGAQTAAIARMIAWLLAAAIVLLSVVPAGFRPVTEAPHVLEHLGIFLLTGMAFRLGYSDRGAFAGLTLLFFAGSIEFAQLWIPGRHARLSDLLINIAGALAGVTVVAIADRLIKNMRPEC